MNYYYYFAENFAGTITVEKLDREQYHQQQKRCNFARIFTRNGNRYFVCFEMDIVTEEQASEVWGWYFNRKNVSEVRLGE